MKEIHIHSEEETRAFGHELARRAQPGCILALIGDLGTGKTTLTRYIAEGLGVTEPVTSPTFTIVKEYRSGRLPLYHFDVYRLSDGEELFQTGAEEYFDAGGVCVIEWADRIAEVLPDETCCIFMSRGEGEEERIYQCTF
ncbi:MAG: tRNA (adenosine(37)-N6)-threonylcarbamoyltransferase complex ATPase subunit type 1 TsaE [Eubacterium sp.]|nr:tRNA (adenosine(37)-N6)-threonylcarbamoyltransferase complex ATPase subunit type 1 TsaE [Eubacterium sp.]